MLIWGIIVQSTANLRLRHFNTHLMILRMSLQYRVILCQESINLKEQTSVVRVTAFTMSSYGVTRPSQQNYNSNDTVENPRFLPVAFSPWMHSLQQLHLTEVDWSDSLIIIVIENF